MRKKKLGRPSQADIKYEKEKQRKREEYQFYAERGVCPQCRTRDAAFGHAYCQECIDKRKLQIDIRDPGHVIRKATKKEQYQQRIAMGLCTDCGKSTKNGRHRCDRCLENNRWNYRIWLHNKRMKGGKTN